MKLSVSGQKTGAPEKLCVDVTMLGSFSVCRGEERISDENSHSRKLFGVLGYLILNRKRRVTQSELIDLLWDDDSDANPVNALKTLLYRIRQMLLPLFPEGTAPILSNRGGYIWNDQIECRTDTDRFEALCARCGDLRLESGTRVRSGREALDLYGGEFMSKMGRQMWVIPIAVRLHNLYMETALLCAGLLEEKKEYGAMESLAARAIRVDPLDERISCALLRALIRQGKDTAALSQYENTTELLYRSLGVRPSEELQAVYREIMASQQALETDLEIIQGQLRETARRTGAFVCEYGFFREIYRLESRRSARNGTCIHVALVTVTNTDGSMPPLEALNATMERLQSTLTESLRRGDVVSRYSAAQYVILLSGANFEDSMMVMERVFSNFRAKYRTIRLKLSYKVRELS